MGRRSTVAAAAITALAAFPAAASASSVQAVAQIGGPNLMSVVASSTPATGAFGSFQVVDQSNNLLQLRGNVVCMTVSGNQAYAIYRDTIPNAFGTVGGYVRMIDNGPAGTTPVDEQNNGRFALQGLNREIANGCPIPTSGQAFHPTHVIQSGEIIITP